MKISQSVEEILGETDVRKDEEERDK